MAGESTEILSTRFDSDKLPDSLQWFCEPTKWQSRASNGEGLTVFVDGKTDFWQKTYYEPELIADNGHFLYSNISDMKVMVETEFDITGSNQFDQAGLMVRIDSGHWIKTGLEYVDGHFRLSCVVTNTYSDWSTQAWSSGKLAIRIYRIGNSYVIENKDTQAGNKWDFIRIAHLNHASDATVSMGLFICAPKAAGMSVHFPYLTYKKVGGYGHSNT